MSKSIHRYLRFFLVVVISSGAIPGFAQNVANYDESKVGTYKLPPLLNSNAGKKVRTSSDWNNIRRKEVLQLFKENMYGQYPGNLTSVHCVIQKIDSSAIDGLAICKQIRIYLVGAENGPYIDLLLYLPANVQKPIPVFAGLNFKGNQSVSRDENILISQNYVDFLKVKNEKQPLKRGEDEKRWPVKTLIQHGYGLATAYCGDLEPDDKEGWKTGIRTTLAESFQLKYSDWSTIGVWAWDLSRILDYLQTDKAVDAGRVIVTGLSRLGKAALWAGANDTRFAAVISTCSGEGGAALTRRNYGENLERITTKTPQWFIPKYKSYVVDINSLPVDQHMLLALAAPRPLYVTSATNDRWADPYGEFLAAKNAEPVYRLFSKKGLGTNKMPVPDATVGKTIRYHIHTGDHDILWSDWMQHIKFADDLVKR